LLILCEAKFNQIGIITEIYYNFDLLLNNKIMKKHIPNFITSLNLAAGFIAIILSFNGYIVAGSWLILAAMIFDFLDGFSARLLNSYSDIGKELDSLADVVSFGVAPAIIIYKLLASSFALTGPMIPDPDNYMVIIILLSPVIMPVFAALRLAKFNTDETQAKSFKGLPTPANALAVISLVIAGHYSDIRIIDLFTGSAVALLIYTVMLSLLMVSRIPLLSLKISHFKFKGNEGRYILILMVIPALAIFGPGGVLLIIPLYIIASLISLIFRQ
jgi:CDP-diacylglycerol--serine O-phosphatidyltransferase